MTVEQTQRLGIYTWTDDSDSFTRSQMTDSHELLEERVATFFRGPSLPTASEVYKQSFFFNTSNNKIYFFNGVDASGSWVEIKDEVIAPSIFTAKGNILAASAPSTPAPLTVGDNNSVLVADSTQTTGLRWSNVLSGLSISAPVLNSPTVNYPVVVSPRESASVLAISAPSTVNFDVLTNSVLYYQLSSASNVALNIRGDASSLFSGYLLPNQAITIVFAMRNGSTARSISSISIDGAVQVVKWQQGITPSGNANSNDVYVLTILRPSTGSYEILASQTRYA